MGRLGASDSGAANLGVSKDAIVNTKIPGGSISGGTGSMAEPRSLVEDGVGLPVLCAALDMFVHRRVESAAALHGQISGGPLAGLSHLQTFPSDLSARLLDLEARLDMLAAASIVGAGGLCFPSRPLGLILPLEADRDGFAPSERAHSLGLHRAGAEDYLGVFLAEHFCQRRERVAGWRRIDYRWNRRLMPEDPDPELCGVIVIGDTEIVCGVRRVGIPPRGNYGRYAQARMTDLWSSLVSKDGPHARSSTGRTYAEFETRVILGRYQYLQAVERYLTDVRQPPVEYGAV